MTCPSNKNTDNFFCEIKRREALIENEPELRDLKRRLNDDLIRKTQECQITEKKYAALRQKVDKYREAHLNKKREANLSKIKMNEINEQQKAKQLHGKELQLQMDLKTVSKISEEKKTKKLERQEMEKMLANFAEEYELYMKEKKKHIDQIQEERNILKKAREAEKKKNELLSLEESRRIDEINQVMEERLKKQEDEQRRKIKLRQELNDEIAKILAEQQKAEMERNKLIEELREYEKKRQENMLDMDRNSNKDSYIKEYKLMLEKQIETNLAHQIFLKEFEYQYKIQLLNDIREFQQLDIIKKRQEKERQIRHAGDVKEQMVMNIRKQKEAKILINMTNDYIKRFNAEREREIEIEKNNMILEHLQKLRK